MNRIEFKTRSKNGIIKVPLKYKELNSEKLRVIIIRDNEKSVNYKLNKFLDFARQVKIKLPVNYRFERDKIYER